MSTIVRPAVGAPPALVMNLDDKAVPMIVRNLKIEVEIAGLVARTTMEMTFGNPHDQDLEGELIFPLPDGAALSGYGLDVEGQMVDASLVEKQLARVVFEEEVRKGVDPGLLEQVAANQFRTRVWPIPAGGTRTVKVAYVSPLATRGGDAFYELPIRFEPPRRDVSKEQVHTFAAWNTMFEEGRPLPDEAFFLSISVAKGANSPAVWDTNEWAETLGFEDRGDAWIAELSRPAGLPDKVRIGLPDVPETSVAVEQQDDTHYFRIDARHEDAGQPETVAVERVALVWDASLSRATIDKQQEFELIRSLFRRWDSVEVELLVLRNVVEPPQQFSVVAGEAEPLLEVLAEMPYDGGTRFGALRVQDPSYDAVLLFSDGVSNLDTDLPEAAGVPFHVINSSPTANQPLLRHLAEQTGGSWLDLTRIPVEEAVERIGVEALTLLGIESSGSDVSDLFPPGVCRLEDGHVGICGRLLVDETEITLRFGRGNRETTRRTVRLRQDTARSTGLIGRLWAQRKVNHLSLFADRHGDEMLALGRTFHIVTPNASLLVLETLEQHLEHGIPPAASRQMMWEEYQRQADERNQTDRKRRDEKLDQVISLWQERVAWWDRSFDLSPPAAKENGDEAPAEGSAAAEWFYHHQGQEQGPVTEADIQRLISQGVLSSLDSVWKDGMADWQPVSSVFPQHAQPGMVQPVNDEDVFDLEEDGSDLAVTGLMPPSPAMAAPELVRAVSILGTVASAFDDEDVYFEAEASIETGDLEPPQTAASIEVKPWDPDMPYLDAMTTAEGDEIYSIYLEQRSGYGRSPSFYLDCADHLFRSGQRDLALRVLTNLSELELESPPLLRILGYKLEAEGELELAAEMFEQVLAMRKEEPQSYRDLALVLERQGEYRRAAQLLWSVIVGEWDERFPEIETIALVELNRLLEHSRRERGEEDSGDADEIDERLVKLLDLDLRVVLAWDVDLTDVDLWVVEPNGEKCYYENNRTRIGGRLSRDFTAGYGPEEYTLHQGIPGTYTIQANYYGSYQQTLTGPATILATIFTNFGRPDEQRRTITVRLSEVKDIVDVGEVTLG